MKKRALITGVCGQDGSYLAELLLDKGYEVYGLKRRTSGDGYGNIKHLVGDITIIEGDLLDQSSMNYSIKEIMPDEVYHLAAQSVTEDSLCPILFAHKLDYVSFGKIWNELVKKKNEIRKEDFHGTEVEVIDLPNNKQICALGMWNGMGTWFPIKQISRHKWSGKVAKLSQKFGSITVTPNHSLLDVNNKICMPEENPWLLNVRKLNCRSGKITDKITLSVIGRYEADERYIWKEQGGNKGKVLKSLEGNALRSFCRFIGAFVSEGHTTFNKSNNSYYVGISNNNKQWLENIAYDLESFYDGTYCYVKHKKEGFEDTWELQIKSRILYSLMRELCGENSLNKKLPHWFANLKKENIINIWTTMLEGDGCIADYNGGMFRYTTVSYKLACQLSMLYTLLGYDYTVHEECNKTHNRSYWHFRQCESYQPKQGEDGKRIEWLNYDGWVYDITVEEVHNFAVGVGNIVVHNSHVATSFKQPLYTADCTGLGTLRLLEAIREFSPTTRFYNAATSELYGGLSGGPYNEESGFHPRSPYGVAKQFGYWTTVNYRESYKIFASNGILFNHSSPRRGEEFATRKITKAAAKIKLGLQDKLSMGNIEAKRDEGHAKDYVEAMYLMLQHHSPDDFVISTGETHSIKEMIEVAFNHVGLDWQKYIYIDPAFFRPAEVNVLCGDCSKAKKILNWKPKYNWKTLLIEMVENDLKLLQK